MIRRYLVPASLLTFVILVAVPVLAQVQPIEGCTIIDKPGSYVLTKNITATMADMQRGPSGWFSACIVIVADFVSFDLQGHTITGPGIQRTWSNSGIYTTADASGKQAMTAQIRNGCITNFDFGVALEGTGHLVEHMRVVANMFGISFATHGHRCYGIRVKDVAAVANTDVGIFFYGGYGGSVENCQVISNGMAGISQTEWLAENNVRPLGTRIVGNTVAGNGRYGIYAFCPSLILQNMAYNNGCSEKLGCHDIVVKDFGCTMSTDNQPAQPNPDYPGGP